MWCLRRPRKLIFIALLGALVWTLYGYLLSKNRDSSNVKQQAGEEDPVLSQYDEMLPVDAFSSKNAEELKLQNDRRIIEEKLKLEAAVEREEKANQMKRDRMKQDLEDFKAMDHLPDIPNNNIIAYQDSKPDRPKPTDTLDIRRRQHRRSKYKISFLPVSYGKSMVTAWPNQAWLIEGGLCHFCGLANHIFLVELTY